MLTQATQEVYRQVQLPTIFLPTPLFSLAYSRTDRELPCLIYGILKQDWSDTCNGTLLHSCTTSRQTRSPSNPEKRMTSKKLAIDHTPTSIQNACQTNLVIDIMKNVFPENIQSLGGYKKPPYGHP